MPNFSRAGKVVAGLIVGGSTIIVATQQWEGDVHYVYADKLARDIPTVCSGHTDWKLRVGTPYTQEECARITSQDTEKYALRIIQCSGHTKDNPVLNQNSLDALTLFGINVGTANACGSRAMRLIKEHKLEQGCDAIANGPDGTPVWSYVHDRHGRQTFVQGLYNRRMFEADWCKRPVVPEQVQPTMTASVLNLFDSLS